MNERTQTTTWSEGARRRLEDYLDAARAWARGRSELDPEELAADLRRHVLDALADRSDPVSEDDVRRVLERLDAPEAWGTEEAEDLAPMRTRWLDSPRTDVAVGLLFWGGLVATAAFAIFPLLPIGAWIAARRRAESMPLGAARRSPWLAPPLLAGEATLWLVALGFPALLALAFAVEGSSASRYALGESTATAAAFVAAVLVGAGALIAALGRARPAAVRRLLPFTSSLAARLPQRSLALVSLLLAASVAITRL